MDAECSTRVGYNILNAALVHGNDICISFNHIYEVEFGYRFLCLVYTVQFFFLVINLRV